MKGKKENCYCLFCTSKCPECGSTDISVYGSTDFEYDNITENTIRVIWRELNATIECNECGFDEVAPGYFGRDILANLPTDFGIDEHNKIKASRTYAEIVDQKE